MEPATGFTITRAGQTRTTFHIPTSPGPAGCLLLGLLVAALILICMPRSAQAADQPGLTEAVMELRLNAQDNGEMLVVLRDRQGGLWLEDSDLARLRLRTPVTPPLTFNGRRYFSIDTIPGALVNIDETAQLAIVTLPGNAFTATTLSSVSQSAPMLARAALGGFANYELSAEHSDYADSSGAYLELGMFSPYGVLTNTVVGSGIDSSYRGLRLETRWAHDFPDRMQTLELGDAINSTGSWGNAVRYGGIRFGTNFAMRPDLITAPLLSASGEAVVPSVVDVFINNQQVSSKDVPPGPFVIDRLPAITGAGDMRVVVRDVLGREQVITVPFYSGARLLQSGLSEYSLELGRIRENFARSSFDYGSLLTTATYRRGMNDWLTLEARGENLQDGPRAFGLSAGMRAGTLGVFSMTLADGGDADDSGWLGAIGFERVGRNASFGLYTQLTSDGFRQVGASTLAAFRPRQRSFAQTSLNLHAAGTLAFAYGVETYHADADLPQREVATLTHSLPVRDTGFVSLTVSHVRADEDSTSAFLIFTMPLPGMRHASVSARHEDLSYGSDTEVAATLQQNPPIGAGTGYRLTASSSGNYDASWLGQFEPAAIELAAARYAGTSAQRAILTGGATLMGGELRASRSVNDSFALVDLGGIPDITVYVENQPVTRTDENGRALLRNLRAYDRNHISVDPTELPLDVSIATRSLIVAPAHRSGANVSFPIVRERSATFRLLLENGQPVPAGANVLLKGNIFPVALDGFTYVTGFDHGMQAQAQWNGGACRFRLDPPPAGDPLPDLGTVVCTPRAQQ